MKIDIWVAIFTPLLFIIFCVIAFVFVYLYKLLNRIERECRRTTEHLHHEITELRAWGTTVSLWSKQPHLQAPPEPTPEPPKNRSRQRQSRADLIPDTDNIDGNL